MSIRSCVKLVEGQQLRNWITEQSFV